MNIAVTLTFTPSFDREPATIPAIDSPCVFDTGIFTYTFPPQVAMRWAWRRMSAPSSAKTSNEIGRSVISLQDPPGELLVVAQPRLPHQRRVRGEALDVGLARRARGSRPVGPVGEDLGPQPVEHGPNLVGEGSCGTVLVLGAQGMLGSAVAAELRAAGHDVRAPARADFDAAVETPAPLLTGGPGTVVNAIGVVKSRIDADDPASVDGAFEVNGRFPQRLARAAGVHGWRVIHPTTDAVFAGTDAPYDERARHDATDPYGQSKSLGEVEAPHVVNLRCSIVGPEPPPGRSLLAWMLNQPQGAQLDGYANQRWNGVTTLHLARLIRAALEQEVPNTLHLVPGDDVTKAQLLQAIASAYGRNDVAITPVDAPTATDLRLTTIHPEANAALWAAAGYPEPPTVAAMLRSWPLSCPAADGRQPHPDDPRHPAGPDPGQPGDPHAQGLARHPVHPRVVWAALR